MMRPIRPRIRADRLLSLAERRGLRPRRGLRTRRLPRGAPRLASEHLQAPAAERTSDLARARSAGGPLDNATYTCSCGYLFSAPVSTGVSCPHCGARQAW